jgi:MFS transporter, FHS family, L-fucose permease
MNLSTGTAIHTAPRKTGLALTVVTTVFFMWGFVTVLNDILVPHLKALFELNYTQTMFTLGIDQLGPLTGKGSGLLIMAIVGGAILPMLQGVLADSIGIHMAFVMPAICYLYIVYYGFSGSRVVRPNLASQRSIP